MNVAARLLPLFWGAVFAAGCGSTPAPKGSRPDSAAEVAGIFDAARDRDVARGVVGPVADGSRSDAVDAAPDARRDAARDVADAAEPDAPVVPAHACSAGHTCTGNARCQRACFGELIYRCSCADGRFVCTGCISVDGGAPDLSPGTPLCATDVGQGRRCDPAGSVCQQRGDGAQRLCACGDLGGGRIWICQ